MSNTLSERLLSGLLSVISVGLRMSVRLDCRSSVHLSNWLSAVMWCGVGWWVL